MILIIREPATLEELAQMNEYFNHKFIKLAVDVQRQILAGGGEFHSDCEEVLLNDGSDQAEVWGADWILAEKKVEFESIINIRPGQQNFKTVVQDPKLRATIEQIVRDLLEVS